MPPQGPPGPQAQQTPLPAAAASSALGDGLAQHQEAAFANNNNHHHDDPFALEKSRAGQPDPDTGEAPCPAGPVAAGTAGTAGHNGYVQGREPPGPHDQQDCDHLDWHAVHDRCGYRDQDVDRELKLLTFQDVPRHLQFNPYIVTGYRPMSTFWGSVRSLFYLHNETVNIVTHGVPIVYILLVVPGLVPWARLDRHGHFLAWCHLVGAVSPWVGSFVYHLFMNLQAGERVYNRLLRLDMFGIWICQSFGALPMVTATVYCLPWSVRWFVISSYCILSLCGLYKAMTAWSPWDRRLSFALPWISRLVLCAVRALMGGGSPHNMLHLILQDGVSLVGGVVGAVYFPEKYFPGMVDYCLNSHNIMHVLTVAAVYSMHCATMHDLEWIASVDCKPAGPPWSLPLPWPAWQPLANQTEL